MTRKRFDFCATLAGFAITVCATIASAATQTSASESPVAHTLANVMVEIVFTATQDYRDPFHEVTVDALFETPEGCTLKVPAFWGGGRTWKVRYASPVQGHPSLAKRVLRDGGPRPTQTLRHGSR